MRKLLLLAGLVVGMPFAAHGQPADGYTYGVADRVVSGSLGALNATVTLPLEGTPGAGGYLAIGTLSGTVTPEACSDSACATWVAVSFLTWSAGSAPTRAATLTGSALFQLELPAGARKARLKVTSYASGSGTGTLVGTATPGTMLPGSSGGGGTSSNFGAAFPAAGTAAGYSDGTNMQGGRAVDTDTGGGTVYVQGVNLLKRASGGPVEVGTSADPLRVDPTGTTAQPVTDNGGSLTVDGTVTANQGSPAATANRWPVQITDGTDLGLVSGSGSVQVTCDNCGGSSPFEDEDAFTVGTSSVAVTGYLVDETSPDSAPEDSAAAPRMAPNRIPYAILRDAAGNERGATVSAANALKVDGSAVTQPVSGTVSATQGTSPWVIGDGGGSVTVDVTGTVVVTDGAGGLTVDGTVTADQGAPGSTGNRWPVQLTDGIDLTTVTAAGELNVLATAQPGVDVGDVTINNAAGAGAVNIQDGGNSITVDGTVAVSGTVAVTQSTSPWVTRDDASLVDNAGFTDGTSRVLPQGQIFDEVAGTALTENDVAASRIDSKRATVAVIEDETTRRRATVSAANALKVDGSAVTQPVSDAGGSLTVDAPVGTPVAVRPSDGSAFVTPADLDIATGGTTVNRQAMALSLAGIAGAALPATGTALAGPVNALDTNLASVGSTAVVTGGALGSLAIGGTTANDTAITQNPVLMAGETIAEGTQPTAATAGRQRRILESTEGVQYVQQGNSNRFSCFVQAVTVTTQCKAAPAAGLRAYVTGFYLSNQAATVQTLDIIFGTGANCATAPTAMTHKFQFGTLATTTAAFVVDAALTTPLIPTAANAICVRPSLATAFGATLTGYVAP